MTDIFEYDDYRKFLKDYFSFKKAKDSKYSLTYFSRLIALSDSYLKQVLAGRRTLNLEKARVLSSKLHFKTLEASYFLTLTIKESAESEELREYFKNILRNFKELRKLDYSNEQDKLSVFQNSLQWEVYTLLGANLSEQGSEFLAKLLTNKKATERSVSQVLETLLATTKTIIMEDNKYETQNIILENSAEIRQIYEIALVRAIEYLQQCKSEDQKQDGFDSFCIVTGKKEFKEIEQLLEETKSKMVAIVKKSEKKECLCYYNTNLFLASKMF